MTQESFLGGFKIRNGFRNIVPYVSAGISNRFIRVAEQSPPPSRPTSACTRLWFGARRSPWRHRWIDVPCAQEDALVFNCGDYLSLLSNGRLK